MLTEPEGHDGHDGEGDPEGPLSGDLGVAGRHQQKSGWPGGRSDVRRVP